jgi:signal transduction histidine kinase
MSGSDRVVATSPADVAALTRDVIASCDSLIRDAGFTVDVTVAGDIPEIPVDAAAFRRALTNLIVNALKYGTDGAWLGVDVSVGTGRAGRPEVVVAVKDRGRGIDAPDLPHIFDAFYRGQYAKDRQIHGNGLGLSLVKGIASAHGGRVSVLSTPGAGATFALHLPA